MWVQRTQCLSVVEFMFDGEKRSLPINTPGVRLGVDGRNHHDTTVRNYREITEKN